MSVAERLLPAKIPDNNRAVVPELPQSIVADGSTEIWDGGVSVKIPLSVDVTTPSCLAAFNDDAQSLPNGKLRTAIGPFERIDSNAAR
jgi:hypothetical protein